MPPKSKFVGATWLGPEDWRLVDHTGTFVKKDGKSYIFTTKEEAEEWAEKNGYHRMNYRGKVHED
jgi:hypothetical protein